MWLYLWISLVSLSAALHYNSKDVLQLDSTKYIKHLKYPVLPSQWKDWKNSNLVNYIIMSKNPIAESGYNITTTPGTVRLGTLIKKWPNQRQEYYSYLMTYLKNPKKYLNVTHVRFYEKSDKNIHSEIKTPLLSYENVPFAFHTEKGPMTNVINRSKMFTHKRQDIEQNDNLNMIPAKLERIGELGKSISIVSVPNSTDDKTLVDKSKTIYFNDVVKNALYKPIFRSKRSFAKYADSNFSFVLNRNKNRINSLYFKPDSENKAFSSQLNFADYINRNKNISKAKRTVANADLTQNTQKNVNKILIRIRPVKKSATLNRFGVHVTRQNIPNSPFLRESENHQLETTSNTVKNDDDLKSMESYLNTYLGLKEMLMGSVITKPKASLIDRWVKLEHSEKHGVSKKHSVLNVHPKTRQRYIRNAYFFNQNSPQMSKIGPNQRLLHDDSGGISIGQYKPSKLSLKYQKSLFSKFKFTLKSNKHNIQELKLNDNLYNSDHTSNYKKLQQRNIDRHSRRFLKNIKNKLNHIVKLKSQYNKLNKESDYVRTNPNFEQKSNLTKIQTYAYFLPISKKEEEKLNNRLHNYKLQKPELANTKLNILPQTTDFQNEKKQKINIQSHGYQPNDKAIEEIKLVNSSLNNVIENNHREEYYNTENIYVSNLNVTSEEEAPNQNNNNTLPVKSLLVDRQHKEELNTKASDLAKKYVNNKLNKEERNEKILFKSEFHRKKPPFIHKQNVQKKIPQNTEPEYIHNHHHIEPYMSEDKKLIEFENPKFIGNTNKVKRVAKIQNNKNTVERLLKQEKMSSEAAPPKKSQHTKRQSFGVYMFDNPFYFDQSDDHKEVDVDMGNVGLVDDVIEQTEFSDEEKRIADAAKPYTRGSKAKIYITEKPMLMPGHVQKVPEKPGHKYARMHGSGTAPLFSNMIWDISNQTKNAVLPHPGSKRYHESQKYNKTQKILRKNKSFEKPFQGKFQELDEDASAMQIYAEEFNFEHLKKRVKLHQQEVTTQKEKTTTLLEPDDYHDEVKHVVNSENGVYRHDLHGENSDYGFKKIEALGYSKHKPFEYSQPDDYLDDIPGDNNIENFKKVEDLTFNDRSSGVRHDIHDHGNFKYSKYQKLKLGEEDEYNELDIGLEVKTPKNNVYVVRNWQKEIPKPKTKMVKFPEVPEKPKILTKNQRKFIVVSPEPHPKLGMYANEESQKTATTEWELITESSLFENYEKFLKEQAIRNIPTHVPETAKNLASAVSTMAKIEVIPTRVSFPVKLDKKGSFYENTLHKAGKYVTGENKTHHKINESDVNKNTFKDDLKHTKVYMHNQTPSEPIYFNEPSNQRVFIHTLRGEKRKNSAHDTKHLINIWSKNHQKVNGDTIVGGVSPLDIWYHKGLHRPKPTEPPELAPEEVEFDMLRKKRGTKPSRLLCCVLKRADQQALVKHVKATWGKRCNVLVFASAHGVDKQSQWESTKSALHYIFAAHFSEADWFLKADINTYVIVENLKYMVRKHNPEKPLYFSRPRLEEHNSFVLSKEALRRLMTVGADSESCRASVNGSIGSCLQYIGVDAVDSRDDHMRARFYPWGPFDFDLTQEYPDEEGQSCWSDYAVAFNNICFQDMYIMEFFLYHIQPYYISKEVVDNVPNELAAEASSKWYRLREKNSDGGVKATDGSQATDQSKGNYESKANEEVKAINDVKENYGNEDNYDMSANDEFNSNYEKDFDDIRDVMETSTKPATIIQPNSLVNNHFLKKY